MIDTKEKILITALHLFAKDGYEAVSVSTIAGELEMTKGALYKHYKNKRDIFDSIVKRMYQKDLERAKRYEVPEETFDKAPLTYRNTSIDKIKGFIESQFHFWIQDEFASDFRRMLTLERYRNPEMADLYQKILGSGPVSYIEDLFREMIEQSTLDGSNPKQLAIEFYAPFYLLLNISDEFSNKDEVTTLFKEQVDRFMKRNFTDRI
ncbi:TetR/AcrR family transcriptional regulator [Paenibacillus sp. 32352]|uniref:TetR/AcrR family transcriptional regulator n=1 Tax=Paenibacillus sp. 32352 TaxID=1969111 RepID=UPI0009AE846D|nr:TetR/AcrR family transcriptional regulator [Paenibacillus sp. 32352]